jgi:hypothetical protein
MNIDFMVGHLVGYYIGCLVTYLILVKKVSR